MGSFQLADKFRIRAELEVIAIIIPTLLELSQIKIILRSTGNLITKKMPFSELISINKAQRLFCLRANLFWRIISIINSSRKRRHTI